MRNIGSWSERWKGELVDLFQALSKVALGFDLVTEDD